MKQRDQRRQPRDQNRKPARYAHRIGIGPDVTWWWAYGGRGVILWSPKGVKYNVHPRVFQRPLPSSPSMDQWEWGRPMAYPSEIRAFIDRITAKNIQPRA